MMRCFESVIEQFKKFNNCLTFSKDYITAEATRIKWCYRPAVRAPHEQLEELFLCFQVVFVVRRPNVNDRLVTFIVESYVPHLRGPRFNCCNKAKNQKSTNSRCINTAATVWQVWGNVGVIANKQWHKTKLTNLLWIKIKIIFSFTIGVSLETAYCQSVKRSLGDVQLCTRRFKFHLNEQKKLCSICLENH